MRVISLVFFLLSTLSTTTFAVTPGEVEIGGYLREATLNGINGKANKFSDFKGKPLMINVWASWCGPCRAEMGSLERLARSYNGNEFNVIDLLGCKVGFLICYDNNLPENVRLTTMLGAEVIFMHKLRKISINSDIGFQIKGHSKTSQYCRGDQPSLSAIECDIHVIFGEWQFRFQPCYSARS